MSPMSSVLVIFVTSIVALPSIGSVPLPFEKCVTNSDCQSSSCCVLSPIRYSIPSCKPFQQKNEQCRLNAETITTNLTYPDESQIQTRGVHYILCPCADGLSCDSKRGVCQLEEFSVQSKRLETS